MEEWLSQPSSAIVEPTPRHFSLISGLLSTVGTGGNLVNDAHLAALALEHDATVVTYDADFGRFTGVRWQLPPSGNRCSPNRAVRNRLQWDDRMNQPESALKVRFCVLIACALSAIALPSPPAGAEAGPPAGAEAGPPAYVALGDSFTAGPQFPLLTEQASGCLRSERNYPRVVAEELRFDAFDDASCSGASIRHMTSPQAFAGGSNPPQLDSLGTGTTVVSLGIGGNDIGFTEIATQCIALVPLGSPCRDRYTAGGVDQIRQRIDQAAARFAATLDEIRRRSPDAKVFVVGYPSVFPETYGGCWPIMPYAADDVEYLRQKQTELNAMLATQAEARQAVYVDVFTASLGRDACAIQGHRWVEPVVTILGAAPVHPNALGMAGAAAQVIAAIRASDS